LLLAAALAAASVVAVAVVVLYIDPHCLLLRVAQ
jgi:hypothetical protein